MTSDFPRLCCVFEWLIGVVVSVAGLVESIAVVDMRCADQQVIEGVLTDVRRVRGWLDSVEVAGAARLAELAETSPSLFPERVVADAARVSLGEASKGFDRACTVAAVPELGWCCNRVLLRRAMSMC
ncbi:MAG: hypothetical protein ACXV8L_02080 [Ilumatobacteraceae bacterium]